MAEASAPRGRSAAARQAGARPTRRGAAARAAERQEERYDLLTAALLGAAVGATAMFLVRRPGARQVMRPLAGLAVGEAGRMAIRAGAGALGAKALERAGRAAAPAIGEAAEHLGDYVRHARSAIDAFLADEVRDLRKAIRRGRRKAGI